MIDKRPKFHPTSVRLPPDLKRDIDIERAKQQHTLSGFIVQILRQWQAFLQSERRVRK